MNLGKNKKIWIPTVVGMMMAALALGWGPGAVNPWGAADESAWGAEDGAEGERAVVLFDRLTDAPDAIWSLIWVNAAYTADLVRIREDGDDATMDLGYIESTGQLDTTGIAAFQGANDLFVARLWDQSGNGFDLSQGTALDQPGFEFDAGLGKWVLTFNGVNQSLTLLNNTMLDVTTGAVSLALGAAVGDMPAVGPVLSKKGIGVNNAGYRMQYSIAEAVAIRIGDGDESIISSSVSPGIDTWHWTLGTASAVSGGNRTTTFYLNGSQSDTDTSVTGTFGSSTNASVLRMGLMSSEEYIGSVNMASIWLSVPGAGDIAIMDNWFTTESIP